MVDIVDLALPEIAIGCKSRHPPPRILAAMPPIALSDEQLTAIMRACAPLRPDARAGFLEAVAAALQGREIGDGSVYLAIASAQKIFFDAPLSTDERSQPNRREVRGAVGRATRTAARARKPYRGPLAAR
jgi:hypothetical protein